MGEYRESYKTVLFQLSRSVRQIISQWFVFLSVFIGYWDRFFFFLSE